MQKEAQLVPHDHIAAEISKCIATDGVRAIARVFGVTIPELKRYVESGTFPPEFVAQWARWEAEKVRHFETRAAELGLVEGPQEASNA